jgi:hypothetical protein
MAAPPTEPQTKMNSTPSRRHIPPASQTMSLLTELDALALPMLQRCQFYGLEKSRFPPGVQPSQYHHLFCDPGPK